MRKELIFRDIFVNIFLNPEDVDVPRIPVDNNFLMLRFKTSRTNVPLKSLSIIDTPWIHLIPTDHVNDVGFLASDQTAIMNAYDWIQESWFFRNLDTNEMLYVPNVYDMNRSAEGIVIVVRHPRNVIVDWESLRYWYDSLQQN